MNDECILFSMQIREYNLKVLFQKSYQDPVAQTGFSSLNPACKKTSSFPPPSIGQQCLVEKPFSGVGIHFDMMGVKFVIPPFFPLNENQSKQKIKILKMCLSCRHFCCLKEEVTQLFYRENVTDAHFKFSLL